MSITVFTPTYNRKKTLPRAYNSLLNQTDKNFLWLIIDDGSVDNTQELVLKWINENKIKIEYHFKKNGGKHTAMRLAYQLTKTKYILGLDSDDELMPNTIETFESEWRKIETAGLKNEFAEISGLTYAQDRKLVGNFHFPSKTRFIDSYWQEMVLKFKNNNEHVVCRNLEKLNECVQIPEEFLFSDKVNFFGEMILWARIGQKYKTRYLNKVLRIYHIDGGESLLRIDDKRKGHYNNLVSTKYFVDENLNYFLWNPKYFTNLVLKFIVSGVELGYSPLFMLKNI
jgi:glycosyltransferase involved in cell wall biosynthesis